MAAIRGGRRTISGPLEVKKAQCKIKRITNLPLRVHSAEQPGSESSSSEARATRSGTASSRTREEARIQDPVLGRLRHQHGLDHELRAQQSGGWDDSDLGR